MRKLITIALLLASSISLATAQKSKDISKYKVKSVTYMVTKVVDGQKTTFKESTITFDSNGNPIEELRFDKTGKLKKKETFVYNKNNKVTEHVIYNADGTVKKKEIKKFNSSNDKIEEIVLDGNGREIKRTRYNYNSFGDKTEEVATDKKGTTRTVFTYDKNGMKSGKEIYDGNGTLIYSKKYDYSY